MQLREKQKVKRIYGVLETQFRNYFEKAERRKGITGENLLQLLERRLDNVVYRLGFARPAAEARQLVRHGHFLVNGRKVDIPSFLVTSGRRRSSCARRAGRSPSVKESLDAGGPEAGVPRWLELDRDSFQAEGQDAAHAGGDARCRSTSS